MKKLLLFCATILISLSSIGMGFPQSTYRQQRILNKTQRKSDISKQLLAYKTTLINEVVGTADGNESIQESFVEMVSNCIIKIFTNKIFQHKDVTIKSYHKCQLEYIAMKKDFEYYVIG